MQQLANGQFKGQCEIGVTVDIDFDIQLDGRQLLQHHYIHFRSILLLLNLHCWSIIRHRNRRHLTQLRCRGLKFEFEAI